MEDDLEQLDIEKLVKRNNLISDPLSQLDIGQLINLSVRNEPVTIEPTVIEPAVIEPAPGVSTSNIPFIEPPKLSLKLEKYFINHDITINQRITEIPEPQRDRQEAEKFFTGKSSLDFFDVFTNEYTI